MNPTRDRVAVIIQQAVGIHAPPSRGGKCAADQGRLKLLARCVTHLAQLLGEYAIGLMCQCVDPEVVHGNASGYGVLTVAKSVPMGRG